MLKHCAAKGDRKKIALIVREMKAYKNIIMTPSKFGQDGRDWFIDKEKLTVSQSLSSVKYISQSNAEELYAAGSEHFDTFVDLLRHLQMNTSLDSRQISALISVGYFDLFGGRTKLMLLFDEFNNGKNRVKKTTKSFAQRLSILHELESSLKDNDWPPEKIAQAEFNLLGMCFSCSDSARANAYVVESVDDAYSIKIGLYSVRRGTSGVVKMKRKLYEADRFKAGDIIIIESGSNKQKALYKDGKRIPLVGEYDYWVERFTVEKEDNNNDNENTQ